MDPVSMIVGAVAAGAAAGLTETVTTAIKDAYQALRSALSERGDVDVAVVEKDPQSSARRAVLHTELNEAGAGDDPELVAQASALLELISEELPDQLRSVGVDIEDVKAGALRVHNVSAEGTGVSVKRGEFDGDIDIEGIRSGKVDSDPN